MCGLNLSNERMGKDNFTYTYNGYGVVMWTIIIDISELEMANIENKQYIYRLERVEIKVEALQENFQ